MQMPLHCEGHLFIYGGQDPGRGLSECLACTTQSIPYPNPTYTLPIPTHTLPIPYKYPTHTLPIPYLYPTYTYPTYTLPIPYLHPTYNNTWEIFFLAASIAHNLRFRITFESFRSDF